jgi:DNA-binding MarR family transcriptional regulator
MENKLFIFGTMFFIVQQWNKKADLILLKNTGITTKQWMLLVLLEKKFPDHLASLSEAALAFGTSRQNLKQIALSLQKKGFLIISNDPNDNRTLRLAITGKHRKFFNDKNNISWQHDFINKCLGNLSENDLLNFKNYIQQLISNINQF